MTNERDAQYRFVIYGTPAPQGSKRHVGHGVLVESSTRLKPWRHSVTEILLAEYPDGPGDKNRSVAISLDFFFRRPRSAPKRRAYPNVRPDADKLARAILDAGTGVLYEDDAQVVALTVRKHYGTPERVEIAMEIKIPEA